MEQAAPAHAANAVLADASCNTNPIPPNDDDYTGPVMLGFDIKFGTRLYSQLHINTNGHVRFSATGPAWYQLKNWEAHGIALIAPFHADVDTRGPGSNRVTYGTTTYDGRPALCINWVDVGYYDANDDKLNSFQLLLVNRGNVGPGDFDIIMNYDRIVWEAGDDSGSTNGVGGWFPPRAGYFDGATAYEFPGSGNITVLLDGEANALTGGANGSLVPGRYVFEIRNGLSPTTAIVEGTVRDPSGFPAAGAPVQACSTCMGTTGTCVMGITNASGYYSLGSFDPADIAVCPTWAVEASPPAGTSFLASAPIPITFTASNQLISNVDATLVAPQGMPAGTTLEPSRDGTNGFPVVYWQDPLDLVTHGCASSIGLPPTVAEYQILQHGQLLLSGAMTENPPRSGRFEATVGPLHPLHGDVTVSMSLTCPDGTTGSYEFSLYIDPSGWVLTTRGEPIQGARVTLYRAESPYGPFEPVPDGSAIMAPSNRANPSYTDAEGHFGWDVMAGYYIVRAEMPGCTAPGDPGRTYVETDILPVPPEWLDLLLYLDCEAITPPVLFVPTRVTADAASAEGAVVSYHVSAIASGEEVPVDCWPRSGEVFPLGVTQVDCSARDAHGNVAQASFEVHVTYAWTGVLPPLDARGSTRLARGSSVPVKFGLTGASTGIHDAAATLLVARVSQGVPGSESPALSVGHGSPAARFRYDPDADQYIFNWSTRGLEPGRYQLRIDLGDGVRRTVQVELGH